MKAYGNTNNTLSPRAHNFIVDIKGELRDLTMVPGDNSIVINPTDSKAWGIDPFYKIKQTDSESEIYKVMSTVAISLIPPYEGSNSFFSDQAREMLKGCFTYYFKYKQGCDTFTKVLRETLSRPIGETVAEILQVATKGGPAFVSVVDFAEISQSTDGEKPRYEATETVTNIYMNFKAKCAMLLADEDIANCLDRKDKAFTPEMLLERDVYFCIPKDKVGQYSQLCYMTLNQIFMWILSLEESSKVRMMGRERLPIGIVFDEVVAVMSSAGGKLSVLIDVLRLARSVGCMVVLCVQSTSGLRCVYKDDEVDDILSNCAFRVYLDATTTSTQKQISESAGTYKERKGTYSVTDGRQSNSLTFEDRPIVEQSDLITLGGSDEAIMISTRTGYCRMKKVPYYKEPFYRRIFDFIQNKKLGI